MIQESSSIHAHTAHAAQALTHASQQDDVLSANLYKRTQT